MCIRDRLITDTVGFISKLPAYLIEAFKSTLEELIFTDIVLVVIDALDNDEQMRKKFSSCYKTLVELGVERKNMIFLFNKSESLDDNRLLHIMNNLKIDEFENCLDVSALTGKNLIDLKQKLQERFYGKNED